MTKTKGRTDKPYSITTGYAAMDTICNGNGETHNGPPWKRRHTGPCGHERNRRIKAGEPITVARWDQKPLITAHCVDCAAAYLPKINEADTPKTPQPQADQRAASNQPEKKGSHKPPRETRREVPQEAPRTKRKNSAQRPGRQPGQKKRACP